MKTTILIDVETLAITDVHFTTRKSWDGHIGMQLFRRNAEDLQIVAPDKNYSWSDLREEWGSRSTRPAIKHEEHNALKKAHNARIDDDVYHQRWMSETGFALLNQDDGEKLRSFSRCGAERHRRHPFAGSSDMGILMVRRLPMTADTASSGSTNQRYEYL